MSMMSPHPAGTAHGRRHTLAVGAAWVSLALPVLAAAWMMIARPTRMTSPDLAYYGMLACGAVSVIAGCLAMSTIGRRIDWNILTPAVLGIVFSAVLGYLCLSFGATGREPIHWHQLRGSQANAPAVRQG